MKLEIEYPVFLDSLKQVKPLLPVKVNNIQRVYLETYAEGVILRVVRIGTTFEYVEVNINCLVLEPGICELLNFPFETVSTIPYGRVIIETQENQGEICIGEYSFTIIVNSDATDYITLPDRSSERVIGGLTLPTFANMLKSAVSFALTSPDSSRYTLDNVLLEYNKEARFLSVVGSDMFHLVVTKKTCIDYLSSGEWFIPVVAAKVIVKLLKKRVGHALLLYENDKVYLILRSEGLVYGVLLVEGRYPQYKSMTNVEECENSVTFDQKVLVTLLKNQVIFVKGVKEKEASIQFMDGYAKFTSYRDGIEGPSINISCDSKVNTGKKLFFNPVYLLAAVKQLKGQVLLSFTDFLCLIYELDNQESPICVVALINKSDGDSEVEVVS